VLERDEHLVVLVWDPERSLPRT